MVMHDAYMYIGGCFWRTKITRKVSDTAENLQSYRVVQFFHPRSSCTMTYISADVQRITLMHRAWRSRVEEPNNSIYSAEFYEWFSQFHSCGTYLVLSRSHSITFSWELSSHIKSSIALVIVLYDLTLCTQIPIDRVTGWPHQHSCYSREMIVKMLNVFWVFVCDMILEFP